MMKNFYLAFFFLYTTLTFSQKLIIEHDPKTPKPSLIAEGKFKVFFQNNTSQSVVLFHSYYKEYGGSERILTRMKNGKVIEKKDNFVPMDTNSKFDSRAFSTIKPGGKKWLTTIALKPEEAGTYTFKYVVKQNPSTIDRRYGKGNAVSLAHQVTPMDIEVVFDYEVKEIEVKPFEKREISAEDLKKAKLYKNLTEAQFDPSAYFRLNINFNNKEAAEKGLPIIGELKNLKELSITLGGDEAITLPASLADLPLETLRLNVKKGKVALPENFMQHQQLKQLFLTGNINNLDFAQTQNQLTNLGLVNIGWTELPSWLGNFANLERLALSEDAFAAVPESIGNLTQLTHLTVSKSQITALPESINKLDNLEYLTLNANQLDNLGDLSGLHKVRKLIVSENQLSILPSTLGQMTALTEINATKNKLRDIEEGFKGLSNLRVLFLMENDFKAIPAVLYQLPKLKQINFRKNNISTIPAGIKSAKLTHLNLEHNKMTAFPQEILEMPYLKHFYVYKNPIEKNKQFKKFAKALGRKLHQ